VEGHKRRKRYHEYKESRGVKPKSRQEEGFYEIRGDSMEKEMIVKSST